MEGQIDKQSESSAAKPVLSSLIAGSRIVFIGNIASKLLNFLLQLLLTHAIGPAAYGRFTLGLSITSLVQSCSEIGLTGIKLPLKPLFLRDL